jgi:hypothetical protein
MRYALRFGFGLTFLGSALPFGVSFSHRFAIYAFLAARCVSLAAISARFRSIWSRVA